MKLWVLKVLVTSVLNLLTVWYICFVDESAQVFNNLPTWCTVLVGAVMGIGTYILVSGTMSLLKLILSRYME